MPNKLFVINIFTQNKRGVIEKITTLVRKKLINLESINTFNLEDKTIKQTTISFEAPESFAIHTMISQLNKIIEVIEVPSYEMREI